MARALAIETSARTGSLAAVENGRVLAEDEFPHGLKHAAEIIPRLDGLCRGQGWSRLYWHTRGSNGNARRLYNNFATADDFVRYRIILE